MLVAQNLFFERVGAAGGAEPSIHTFGYNCPKVLIYRVDRTDRVSAIYLPTFIGSIAMSTVN